MHRESMSLTCFYSFFSPNRSLRIVVFRSFRRMYFACLLMSDSSYELKTSERHLIKTEKPQEVI